MICLSFPGRGQNSTRGSGRRAAWGDQRGGIQHKALPGPQRDSPSTTIHAEQEHWKHSPGSSQRRYKGHYFPAAHKLAHQNKGQVCLPQMAGGLLPLQTLFESLGLSFAVNSCQTNSCKGFIPFPQGSQGFCVNRSVRVCSAVRRPQPSGESLDDTESNHPQRQNGSALSVTSQCI